jgi:hypothetical protein
MHTCINQQFPKRDFRHASLFGDARARATQVQQIRNRGGNHITTEPSSVINRPNPDNRYNDGYTNDRYANRYDGRDDSRYSNNVSDSISSSRASGGGNLDDVDFAGDPVLRQRLAGLLEEYGSRRVMELLERHTRGT